MRTLAFVLVLGAWPATASATPDLEASIPCFETAVADGAPRSCITCHATANASTCPGSGCLDAFGAAFLANGSTWNGALAALDSDGDGWTDGEELGDPLGTWRMDDARPSVCACASDPGTATGTPADDDADGDGYCCRGRDADASGTCLGAGEHDDSFDCDDAVATTSSGATELCTNLVDDDCDGLPTLDDADCTSVVDRDRDGWCPMGRDLDADRSCLDAGEATDDEDCDDSRPSVSPGSVELCLGGLDDDCDGLADAADTLDCVPDVDADGDGFCTRGRDGNADGDCLDPGEEPLGYDCDDTDPEVFDGATELCSGGRDEDCDGLGDFLDTDCTAFIDADDDGFCPIGQDLDDDRSCVDPGEDVTPTDCDDTRRDVHPGVPELCENRIDDDCDGNFDGEDAECMCTSDGICDDLDPCTVDRCETDRRCYHTLVCDAGVPSDAGMPDASVPIDAASDPDAGSPDAAVRVDAGRDAALIDAGIAPPASTSCGCSARSATTPYPLLVLALLFIRRSRRAARSAPGTTPPGRRASRGC